MNVNPITRLDYPDPDVIRVEDTYYMVSTTMHFMPGCEILQSFDLVHWEHVTYVYETLDHTGRGGVYGSAPVRIFRCGAAVLYPAHDGTDR